MKLLAFIIVILSACLLDNLNDAAPKPLLPEHTHVCKWPSCPYKGVKESDWDNAVTKYVGESGTDAWCIDMLHLEHPTLDYDSLDSLLFSPSEKYSLIR